MRVPVRSGLNLSDLMMSTWKVEDVSSPSSGQREPSSGGCGSGAPTPGTFSQFQDWCLRTYGDSGKTKTVTRRKYNRILQTLQQRDETGTGLFLPGGTVNAKFKFWVKSKGFQVQESRTGAPERPVLYVPIRNTVSTTPPAPPIKLMISGFILILTRFNLRNFLYFPLIWAGPEWRVLELISYLV